MTSTLQELAETQFASAQIIAALARDAASTTLPTLAVAQVLFLDSAEMQELFGSHLTARQAVEYARNCPATNIVTLMTDEGGKANV
ncbi:hypothetical protein [Streptomyces cacaoi]